MGINVASNFDVSTNLPLDSRSVKADITARNAIASGVRFDGLKVYVIATQKTYVLKGGITDSDWYEDGGAGSGVTSVADVTARNNIPEASRSAGMLVHTVSGDVIYKLIGTPSGATTTDSNWDALITLSSLRAVSNTQTLTGGGTVTRTGARTELVQVQGTSGETTVTLNSSPTPLKGDQLFVEGMSDANPIILDLSYITIYLTAALVAHLIYDGTGWRKVGGV